MRQIRFFFLLGVLLLSGLLAGCSGGGANVQSAVNTTTMGQELMDLDASYEKGIITKDQYEKAKKDILRRYNN